MTMLDWSTAEVKTGGRLSVRFANSAGPFSTPPSAWGQDDAFNRAFEELAASRHGWSKPLLRGSVSIEGVQEGAEADVRDKLNALVGEADALAGKYREQQQQEDEKSARVEREGRESAARMTERFRTED